MRDVVCKMFRYGVIIRFSNDLLYILVLVCSNYVEI